MPYDPSLNATYRSFLMDVEDMFVGKTLRDKRSRIREVCPFHRASYIEEPRDRLVDAHVIDFPIKWSGLLLHHVSPFDQYYLPYCFQQCARRGGDGEPRPSSRGKGARVSGRCVDCGNRGRHRQR
ncbi:hypothetical protein NQL31_006570 [Lotmaria passim]